MKLKLTFKLAFAFLTGILSGQLLTYGIIVWAGRPGLPGGEALILPLFGLLVWFGYQFGRESRILRRDFREYESGFHDGYEAGLETAEVHVHPVHIEIQQDLLQHKQAN